MSILPKALALAERGFSVFPCGASKRPTCERGYLAAESEPLKVEALFKQYPGELIGVPTGAVNGFDVLDWDPKNGGADSIAVLRPRIPDTREHRTRSGGGHLVFLHHDGIRNTASKIARGIDTRGDGGYIIWWPAHGSLISNVAAPQPWPAQLLSLLLPKQEEAPTQGAWKGRIAENDTEARRLIQRQIDRVQRAAPGDRHIRLRTAGLVIGGLLGLDDAISQAEVAAGLLSAIKQAGGGEVVDSNAKATIEWALAEGRKKPLHMRGTNG